MHSLRYGMQYDPMTTQPQDQARILVEHLGGVPPVASLFGIRKPSLFGWFARGVPPARLQTLRAWARLPDAEFLPERTITPKRVREALKAAQLDERKRRK